MIRTKYSTPHETEEDKLNRRFKYLEARDKFDCEIARILRDWRMSKFRMVMEGRAKPVMIYGNKTNIKEEA